MATVESSSTDDVFTLNVDIENIAPGVLPTC